MQVDHPHRGKQAPVRGLSTVVTGSLGTPSSCRVRARARWPWLFFRRLALLLVLALVLFCHAGLAGTVSSPRRTYDEINSPDRKSVHAIDRNIWVFDQAFAERFTMPERWIDKSLQGAYALAYRPEWTYQRTCTGQGEQRRCAPIHHCLLDLYLPKTLDLAWASDRPFDYNPRHHYNSQRFLTPQRPEDRFPWEHPSGDKGLDKVVGFDRVEGVFAIDGAQQTRPIEVMRYERRRFQDMDIVILRLDSCKPDQDDEPLRLRLPLRTAGKGTPPTSDAAASSLPEGGPWHEVVIPTPFVAKMGEHRRRYFGPESQAEIDKFLSGYDAMPRFRAEEMQRKGWLGKVAALYTRLTGDSADKGKEAASTPYDVYFGPQATGSYLEDQNVWTYSPAFAKRFGMPEKWIDPHLQGVEAMAFRVEWWPTKDCGYFGDPKVCRFWDRCILDLYTPKSADIEWAETDDVGHSSYFNLLQTRFFVPKNEVDKNKRDAFRKAKLGPRNIALGRHDAGGDNVIIQLINRPLFYDRSLHNGVDLNIISVSCILDTKESLKYGLGPVTGSTYHPNQFHNVVYSRRLHLRVIDYYRVSVEQRSLWSEIKRNLLEAPSKHADRG